MPDNAPRSFEFQLPAFHESSREAFACLLRTTTSGFWYTDLQGRILAVNESYSRMSGYPVAELVGMNISDLEAEESPRETARHIERLKAEGHHLFETRHRRKDGTLWDVEVSVGLLSGDQDFLLAFFRDMTEQKQAAVDLARQLELNNRVFNATDAHMAVIAADGTILNVNAAWRRFAGDNCGLDQATLGVGAQYFRPVRETFGDTTAADDAYAGVRAVQAGELPFFSIEYPCDHPDGTGRWFQLRAYPIDGEEGTILVSHENITEQKLAQQEMLKAAKLESLGVLAGSLAHDFNNVLTGVIGHVSLARRQLEEGHPALRSLSLASLAAGKARDLAGRFLTFTRGGAPVKSDVPVRPLVEDAVALSLAGGDIQVTLAIAEDVSCLRADGGQIGLAFQNLILNARQALGTSGELRIQAVNLELAENNPLDLAPGRYVRFEFADNGPGIAPQLQPRIFEPYFTTREHGTGLGLASVYSIVRQHGGLVRVESSPGQGATFILHLPASRQPVVEAGGEKETAVLRTGEFQGAALFMDDDPIIRSLGEAMLGQLGFQVDVCRDGGEAAAMYGEALGTPTPYVVAVLDLTIEGGAGGCEAAERIRSLDSGAVLVVTSGRSNDPVLLNPAAHGFAGALVKPYDFEELRRVLTRVLSGE